MSAHPNRPRPKGLRSLAEHETQSLRWVSSATPRCTQCSGGRELGSLIIITKLVEWPVVDSVPRHSLGSGGVGVNARQMSTQCVTQLPLARQLCQSGRSRPLSLAPAHLVLYTGQS